MAFLDAAPAVDVDAAEYARLLGFPRGHTLDGRALRAGRLGARVVRGTRPAVGPRAPGGHAGDRRRRDVTSRASRSGATACTRTLEQAGAHGAVLVAVSAGPEVEREAHQAWLRRKA